MTIMYTTLRLSIHVPVFLTLSLVAYTNPLVIYTYGFAISTNRYLRPYLQSNHYVLCTVTYHSVPFRINTYQRSDNYHIGIQPVSFYGSFLF